MAHTQVEIIKTREAQTARLLAIKYCHIENIIALAIKRKDLFIHFVRGLTRQHLKVLIDLIPRRLERSQYPPMGPNVPPLDEGVVQRLMWDRRPRITPAGDDLLALQMLHAYGLVEEYIKSSIEEPRIPVMISSESQLRSAVRDFANSLANPEITRSFSLSPLGNEFLKFVGLPKETGCPAATECRGADGR